MVILSVFRSFHSTGIRSRTLQNHLIFMLPGSLHLWPQENARVPLGRPGGWSRTVFSFGLESFQNVAVVTISPLFTEVPLSRFRRQIHRCNSANFPNNQNYIRVCLISTDQTSHPSTRRSIALSVCVFWGEFSMKKMNRKIVCFWARATCSRQEVRFRCLGDSVKFLAPSPPNFPHIYFSFDISPVLL